MQAKQKLKEAIIKMMSAPEPGDGQGPEPLADAVTEVFDSFAMLVAERTIEANSGCIGSLIADTQAKT